MLYKKYHRNFVSRFKKEVKFIVGRYGNGNGYRVTIEPYIPDPSPSRIYIKDGKSCTWTLVYFSGKINKYLHVI